MKALPINLYVVSGNLTGDPQLNRVGANDTPLLTFSIANNLVYTRDGKQQTKTAFIRIVVWKDAAERLYPQLSTGTAVLVKGRIQTGSYVDRDGNKRQSWEVNAQNVYVLGGSPVAQTEPKTAPEPPPAHDVPDDDIPF